MMRACFRAVCVFTFAALGSLASAQPVLNFTAPATANPPATPLGNGNQNVAITLALVGSNVFGNLLTQTLNAQSAVKTCDAANARKGGKLSRQLWVESCH